MYKYLIDHARQNVWCNNEQDNQLIIKGHRITSSKGGVINDFRLMKRKLRLPTEGRRYHIYQIGQVRPQVLGLLCRQPEWLIERWISFQDAINQLKLFVNLYTKEGMEIPKFESYYLFTHERNLIIAIPENINFPINFILDGIYLRVYTNAYYQTLMSDGRDDYLECSGRTVINNSHILDLQGKVNALRSRHGYVYCYCNGFYIDNIDPVRVNLGDTVEYIYDSSIKRVVTFTVRDLLTFNSVLDNKYKYLLHHLSGNNDTIDYQDDIDIHIVHHTNNKYKGYYYHRNNVDSHRMITHRDYSIVVDYFEYIANHLVGRHSSDPIDLLDLKLIVKIRNSGYYRPLIFDNNRIFELYKLSDERILQAMVGVNATVPEWRAEELENSAYTRIMRSDFKDIDIPMVQEGYGYNGISKVVGDTPLKTVLKHGRQTASLPYGLFYNSTVYEYDVNGHLLGYYHHIEGSEYSCVNDDTRLIEVISGKGTHEPDVTFGRNNIPLPSYYNYRVYMSYLVDGESNEIWEDITESDLYVVNDNILEWNSGITDHYLMVRTDKTFLAYDLSFKPVGGNLYFPFTEFENRYGIIEHYILPVPLGELDIFLNGRSLIRNLDYIIKYPYVYIINKRYLTQPANDVKQNIHVRFTGFCDSDMQLDPIEDSGFIVHGVLSNNNKFDIRDDRVMRITVDGSLKHRDDLIFSELHGGSNVVNTINGSPYQIKDIVVPLKELVNENTYSLRDKSIAIDNRISDYLTLRLPQPDREHEAAIPERYPVISPFISRILIDLLKNVISMSAITVSLTDNKIIEICEPYEYLLDFDPINDVNKLNDRYVIIEPHNASHVIDLNLYQYRFFKRVVELYANNLIEISHHITLSS